MAAGRAARTAQRHVSSGPKRAVHCRRRVGHVHPDLGGRVPPRWRHRHTGSALRHGRLRAARRHGAAARERPQQRRGTRTARPLCPSMAIDVVPFRVLPGDDASCLNLYEPRQPRILGVGHEFVAAGRFAFGRSLDRSDEERANPWQLLEREQRDEAIPVIADANSMTYVLHRSLGDDIVINHAGRPVTLRLVAALSDSIFQGELLMSEANFLKLFPEQEGYQFLLVNAPPARAGDVAAIIEDRLTDHGADATPTGRAPRRISQSREHLSLDIPDARGTGASARHDRARGRAAAQRARAPPRIGAARRSRLRPLPPVHHRDRRERLPADVRAGWRARSVRSWPSRRRPSTGAAGRRPASGSGCCSLRCSAPASSPRSSRRGRPCRQDCSRRSARNSDRGMIHTEAT